MDTTAISSWSLFLAINGKKVLQENNNCNVLSLSLPPKDTQIDDIFSLVSLISGW